MAIDTKTPEEIAEQYLTHLKSLKPSVNRDQTDSDWWIRSRVVGGLLSGMYADQRLIANDAFPQRARHDALGRHLELYFGDTFHNATQSQGNLKVTGVTGSSIPFGSSFSYDPNGNTYQATSGILFGAATAVLVPVQSVNTGQSQNLLSGAILTLTSPPPGVDSSATASGNIADGRNAETDAEAAARILERVRSPIAGGTESDYKQWAKEAAPSVIEANILRFPFGLGTVGVVFTAGTTDIDTAIDNDQPIVVIPSDALVDTVAEYIDAKRPLTDCVTVLKPSEVAIDVTVNVAYVQGSNGTIIAGQTLTQEQLVQREVRRAIYKTPPGGRQIGASGFVVASDIEETIDLGLSSSPNTVGTLSLLLDRQVQNLSITGANRAVLANEVAVPGTITVVAV